MVFGIITATAICPAISATKQAIEGGIKGNRRAGNKSLDLEVFITFKGGGVGDPGEVYKGKFEGAEVVLGEDGKVGDLCSFFICSCEVCERFLQKLTIENRYTSSTPDPNFHPILSARWSAISRQWKRIHSPGRG